MGDSGLAADRGIYRRRKTTDKRRPLLGAGSVTASSGSTLHAACCNCSLNPQRLWPAAAPTLQQLRLAPKDRKGNTQDEGAVCSIRKVGISPGWISCELCLLHQASAPKGVEGGTPNQDLTCQICLATC